MRVPLPNILEGGQGTLLNPSGIVEWVIAPTMLLSNLNENCPNRRR